MRLRLTLVLVALIILLSIGLAGCDPGGAWRDPRASTGDSFYEVGERGDYGRLKVFCEKSTFNRIYVVGFDSPGVFVVPGGCK